VYNLRQFAFSNESNFKSLEAKLHTGGETIFMNSNHVLGQVRHVGAVLKILSPVIEFFKRHKTLSVILGIVAYLWVFTSVKSLAVTVWIILAASVLCFAPKVWQEIKGAFSREKEGEYKTRIRWWVAAVYLLWALAVVVMLTQSLSQLQEIEKPIEQFTERVTQYSVKHVNAPGAIEARRAVVFSLLFNIFGLLGAAGVAAATANPFHWLNKKRLFWGGFALALMLGRPLVGFLSPAMGWIVSLAPPIRTAPVLILVYRIMPFGIQLMAGSVFVGVAALSFGAVFGMVTAPIVFLFSYLLQIDQSLTIFRYQKTGLIGYVYRFGYWLRRESPPVVPDDSKGARFATSPEIIAQANESLEKNPQAVAVFGHLNGSPLPLYTDKHILIMASTRSGKGVSLIIPHLLRYTGSAFVLDPKGENARATGRHRAAINGKVHYLDPFGLTGKPQARFNPLARFTPENMEAESKALAAALVMGERGVRDHWTASAQQLLAAFIMHVVTSPDVAPENKDLPTVRRLLLRNINGVFKAMRDSGVADGLLSSLAQSFIDTPEKELGSIISTAQRETEILDNPSIIACLKAAGAGDEMDFAEWHKGTMTVYLCLSAPKFPVFSRWLRLVLTSALDEMTNTLNPPALPVCFMLDELATLGHLAAVENAVGLAAGYGIQLVTVFQDVAQMKDLYKGRWASFIGNAGVRALFSLDDFDTAKYWSNFLGGHLVETRSQAQDVYGFTKGQTMGEAMRPLLSPEELMLQFAQGKMLVLPQGSRPIVSDRVAYWQDPALNGLWDDPRGPVAAPVSSGAKKDYKGKK
jgi:type IV secretion system protein VirD4